MALTKLKNEIRENLKQFIKKMNEEHGYSVEHSKTILISEVMDSANELGMYDTPRSDQKFHCK